MIRQYGGHQPIIHKIQSASYLLSYICCKTQFQLRSMQCHTPVTQTTYITSQFTTPGTYMQVPVTQLSRQEGTCGQDAGLYLLSQIVHRQILCLRPVMFTLFIASCAHMVIPCKESHNLSPPKVCLLSRELIYVGIIVCLIDGTLGPLNSTLGLLGSTLGLLNSTLGLLNSTLGLLNSTQGFKSLNQKYLTS